MAPGARQGEVARGAGVKGADTVGSWSRLRVGVHPEGGSKREAVAIRVAADPAAVTGSTRRVAGIGWEGVIS